jgi:hypothetical protein
MPPTPWRAHTSTGLCVSESDSTPSKLTAVVNLDQELDLRGKIAARGGDYANGQRAWAANVACCWGDADLKMTCEKAWRCRIPAYKAGNDAGADADGRPLAFNAPVESHPGETTHGSRNVCDRQSLNRAQGHV